MHKAEQEPETTTPEYDYTQLSGMTLLTELSSPSAVALEYTDFNFVGTQHQCDFKRGFMSNITQGNCDWSRAASGNNSSCHDA